MAQRTALNVVMSVVQTSNYVPTLLSLKKQFKCYGKPPITLFALNSAIYIVVVLVVVVVNT